MLIDHIRINVSISSSNNGRVIFNIFSNQMTCFSTRHQKICVLRTIQKTIFRIADVTLSREIVMNKVNDKTLMNKFTILNGKDILHCIRSIPIDFAILIRLILCEHYIHFTAMENTTLNIKLLIKI